VAFAMRALAILRPARLQVVVYQGTRELRVERGPRSHAAGPAGGEWAMVGIPPHASREHIAWGLAELAGVAHVPFMVDLLLRRASRHPYR
ncbi:MAG: hypothetical protein KC731_42780, partial [Myxococcales bacterium]|nr:hypothetical protein [Myxococcales bacterium]